MVIMHSPEYRAHLQSPSWRATARSTLALTKHRCALIPLLRASEAHHMSYRRLGREWVWLDTVPLSWAGHAIVHAFFLWAYPMRGFMNAWLRLSALLVAILVRPLLLLAVVAVATWGWMSYGQVVMTAIATMQGQVAASVTSLRGMW
jgi:hypothetical protein